MRFAYVPDGQSTYYRRVLRGVARFARSRDDVEVQAEHLTSLGAYYALDRVGYDGVILGSFSERSEEVGRLRTPAISVSNTYPGLRFPQVVTDDREVGRLVAQHLLSKGYRHFAYWGTEFIWGQQRWEGFSSTIIAARGEECAPARTTTRGRTAIRRWLRRLPLPLGLMTANDMMGADAIEACHRLGLRVPEDIAVVGVDDDDFFSELTKPPLSSVAQQSERIGYLAAELLARLVLGETIPDSTIIPPGPLMARQSSHGIVTTDTLVAQAALFMAQNLTRGANIASVTEAFHVSRRSLELRFEAALGRTPGQELVRLRIDRARDLLATTNLPLKQVALLSGFSGPVRMNQVFRQSLNQTPLAYRRAFLPQ